MRVRKARPVQAAASPGVIDARTPLYLLTLEVPYLLATGQVYPHAWLALLRTSNAPYRYDFPSLLPAYGPGVERGPEACFLYQDCFTWEELREIRAYFARHPWPGATLVVDPVTLPVPRQTQMTQLVHRPGPWVKCTFPEQSYFDCPVAFEGYYNPQWPQRAQVVCNTWSPLARAGQA